jgi:hypothetical protein
MDLVAINQTIFDEFRRITGSSCRFEFPLWWAGIVRAVSKERGPSSWALLTRVEQYDAIRAHLGSQPPAKWPSLRLVGAV